ncbi:spore coat protein [Clostridium sp.]|uniref:spore coat protein n=1 Tax=Clostridium sp. TaxID=1506 RepID=UPI002618B317|nr:spore coat protein [Clostridium sp.]
MNELSMIEYLDGKGITIIGQNFSYDKNIQKRDIVSQIELIVEVHKILVGCNFAGLNRIKSSIGKEVESYKVQIKKLQRHYDYIISKPCTNDIEKIILSNGKIMLRKAKKALNYIYENDYYGVIKRSMNREEICIGKVDKNNLRKIQGKIEIGTIKGMAYNLVEEDLYNYIKKLQRKEFDIEEEELIKIFVRGSHLSFNSFDYLKGLCSYPKDFLKTWERYRDRKRDDNLEIRSTLSECKLKNKDNKKEKTIEEILLELKKSLKYESKSFII